MKLFTAIIIALLPSLGLSMDMPKRAERSIVNGTQEALTIEYTLCAFLWDTIKKESSEVTCKRQTPFTLNKEESKEFDLNPTPISDHTEKYFFLHVSKIKSQTKYQYFIADYSDHLNYKKYYESLPQKGLNKVSSLCRIKYNSRHTYIYGSTRGFVCVS